MREYRYGMRLRGFAPMCQPKGVIRREDDPKGRYHDIIVYDHPLTEKEMEDYELDEVQQRGYLNKEGSRTRNYNDS